MPSGGEVGRRLPASITTAIARRLKELRLDQRPPLTQGEAARRIGISQGALSQLEAGEKLPSLPTLLGMQRAYNLASLEQLFGELPSRTLTWPTDETS
jgi:transcriptional regulator with XRE-family HTH domain